MQILEHIILKSMKGNEKISIKDEKQLMDMIVMSSNHLIDSFVYDYIDVEVDLEEQKRVIYDFWRKEVFRKVLDCKKRFGIFAEVVNGLDSKEIDYSFLKGPLLQRLYPKESQRYMGDFDILVREKDFDRAIVVLQGIGYKHVDTDIGDYDIKLLHDEGMVIELHYNVSTKDLHSNIDQFRDALLDYKTSYYYQGVKFYGPSVNRHLVYLLLHASNHLFFDSVGLRAFLDIRLYIDQYRDQLEWKEIDCELEKLGIKRIADYFFDYMKRNLGLVIFDRDVLIEPEIYSELEEIIRSGGMFKKIDKVDRFDYVYKKYLSEDITNEKNIYKRMRILFPRPGQLKYKYNYAKKLPILLPFAWIHRIAFELKYDKGRAFGFMKSQPDDENVRRQIKVLNYFGLVRR